MDSNSLHFPGQEPDETVVMALRRHTVALFRHIALFIGGIALPILIYLLLASYTAWFENTTSFFYVLFVLGASLFYLYVLFFMFHGWADYYLDIWIVTNERIVAIEQKGMFNRVVSELRLDKIQDVSSEVRGVFPTMFDYGSVHVQTASEVNKFIFSEVPSPDKVSSAILEMHEQYVGTDQPAVSAAAHQHATHNTTHPDEA